jgi:hypothetical protein
LLKNRGYKIETSLISLVPVERIELPTFGLQNRCSTAELNRQTLEIMPLAVDEAGSAVKYQSCSARATGSKNRYG